MSDIAVISALCIISAIVCRFFEGSFREYKPLVSICACVAGFAFVLVLVQPVCTFITDMMNSVGAFDKYGDILFKSAGISIIAQLGADVCRDANETALSTIVQIAARFSLAALSVALLADIADTVMELTL